ncbi:MBL fold metallo-hydrolase [Pseudescherichia sp.]|uniref:MBL fold metallo-hydrolase n=1 Tax=Pseudescherichia sp. TaxID=2055881 RepID=UPI0028A59333|nr:MBL fold metallo-hydrolase [Pseudescherichia sp.]
MLKVTVLLENRKAKQADGLICRPGLSLLIEDDITRILFDTGPDNSFIHNAEKMGVSLEHIDWVVLSHGHYDHCGGLKHLHKLPKVLCHPGVYDHKYAGVKILNRFIAIKKISTQLPSVKHDFFFTKKPYEISNKFIWSGEIASAKSYGYVKGERVEPDVLKDEGVLIYKSGKGLVIFTGCGHKGLRNIIEHCKRLTGVSTIYAIIGGMHLRHAMPWSLMSLRSYIKAVNPEQIFTCHCTGKWGKLWMPDAEEINTGDVIELL